MTLDREEERLRAAERPIHCGEYRKLSPTDHAAPPVRIEGPAADVEEMGGEQPCQAHQFWNLEED